MPLVFVYGTLKRGDVRAGELREASYLGPARTQPLYRLYDCGEYPGLVLADSAREGRSIEGEVYDVPGSLLDRLDEVEGVLEGLYARERIHLRGPFEEEPVEAYFYRIAVAGLPDCGVRWERQKS